MLSVTFKLIFRNIWKYKGTSLINILGLSVGMACSILLLMWVNYHRQFDRFHENPEQVYRVIQHIKFEDLTTWCITQGPLGPALKEEIPEVADYCRLTGSGLRFRMEEGDPVREQGTYADPSFFSMFTLRVTSRLNDSPLSDPNHIALSESMARRYFGDEDPVGKVIRALPDRDFTVAAVFEDYPKQSHWWFDYIIPFEHLADLGYSIDYWGNSGYNTYVSLSEGVDQEMGREKVKDFLEEKPTLENYAKLDLQAIDEIHTTTGIDFESASTVDPRYMTIFLVIGIFLIFIACINFMNLATARSTGRMKEIGMKKTVGAQRWRLLLQFFGEAVIISLIAVFFAMMMVELVRPAFNRISGTELFIDYGKAGVYAGMLGFAFFTGILSGTYPAVYLSTFRPIHALRGVREGVRGSWLFRRVLVIFQFVISITLITLTLIISSQVTYMLNKDLGYSTEGLVFFSMSDGFMEHYESIREDLLSYPSVHSVTRSGNLLTEGYNFSNSRFRWDGQDLSKETLFRALFVDYDYFSTLQIGMKEGRGFSRDFASDSSGVILNQSAILAMGVSDPVGMEMRHLNNDSTSIRYRVIGVAEDYHFRSLHSDIEPQIMILNSDISYVAILKIDLASYQEVLKLLEVHWDKHESSGPLSVEFLDEHIAALYDSDRSLRNIILYFTFIGLLISILGLIGLTGFTIEQKTKEVGIRKLLGARFTDILSLVSIRFMRWIGISLMFSVPLSYFLMDRWLEEFPYRIHLHWWLLLTGGLVALLVALVTIALQVGRATRNNPADSLRYE